MLLIVPLAAFFLAFIPMGTIVRLADLRLPMIRGTRLTWEGAILRIHYRQLARRNQLDGGSNKTDEYCLMQDGKVCTFFVEDLDYTSAQI
jgi:hypothetical protein